MTRFAIILTTFLLCSCANVPLGTMLKFSLFSKNDFVALQPQDLRAKIQLDEPVRADIQSAELTLELTTAKGIREFNFPLLLLRQEKIESEAGFFTKSAGKTEYTLKLADEAIESFIETQHIVRHEQTGSLRFSVRTGFDSLPSEIKEIGLSVFLKLSDEKGFVTLFDDAKLAVKHEG